MLEFVEGFPAGNCFKNWKFYPYQACISVL